MSRMRAYPSPGSMVWGTPPLPYHRSYLSLCGCGKCTLYKKGVVTWDCPAARAAYVRSAVFAGRVGQATTACAVAEGVLVP